MVKAQPIPRRLIRLKPGAAYLGKSEWTFREMLRAGEIPVVRGREREPWLVDIKDLDAWIEQNKTRL